MLLEATAGAAGLVATLLLPLLLAVLLCRTELEAQPISGTDKKLAAVSPNPCCKKSLRDAIVLSVKSNIGTIAYAEGKKNQS
ncbi:hypothetical protein GJ699_12050 [Duganella sp. FT80W]|uniref:Uncharacterized protein n=1 Tax=Duganella guangzhouensis TaxID=2666084 RepID=A0A6I2KYA5_9BURK|nr:hypothetical protein [Duganella guangzhouensis]MRW90723.1 hypothetical protein [Duganella guangzhouensis]